MLPKLKTSTNRLKNQSMATSVAIDSGFISPKAKTTVSLRKSGDETF
jgi:hypothetical protein